MRAKKHFGQNFLKDAFYLDRIIQSIPKSVLEYDLVEVGAGLGDLTQRLLGLRNITSYEIDKDLVHFLQKEYHSFLESRRWQLIFGDVLKCWSGDSLCKAPFFLVANLPYNIATRVVLNALRDDLCRGFVVMVQQEVAEKFCARGGSLSALGVLAQSVGEVELLFSVPPQAFSPIPKVHSAVFRLLKVDGVFNKRAVFDQLNALLKVCFLSPRKTLFKNLATSFEREKLEFIFHSLEISKNVRPHELEIVTYHRLLDFL